MNEEHYQRVVQALKHPADDRQDVNLEMAKAIISLQEAVLADRAALARLERDVQDLKRAKVLITDPLSVSGDAC
jgi:hypothetical protein